MKAGFAAFVLMLGASMAQAKIHTEEIDYKHGDVALQGYLAYDDAITGNGNIPSNPGSASAVDDVRSGNDEVIFLTMRRSKCGQN